jgi:hypothetical protein
MLALSLCLFVSIGFGTDYPYNVGTGIWDITGPAAEGKRVLSLYSYCASWHDGLR